MPAVNTARWLMAIDAHPETVDTDLLVATALANDDPNVEGVVPELVSDSVEELVALGFLEPVLVDGGDTDPRCSPTRHVAGCEYRAEHLLELRLPA